MAVSTVVHKEPFDRRRRLNELGLDEDWLLRAVLRGHAARTACTPNHPPLFPGISAWAETVCALREELLPNAFKRSDEGNLPFTVNAPDTMAIAVATGDEYTGTDESPCTKNNKGPRTRNAVAVNQLPLPLDFGEGRVSPEALEAIRRRKTWILLIHVDVKANQLRSELSLPINMSEEGRVDGWEERIILNAHPLDGDEISFVGDDLDDGPRSPEIVVEVKRRA